jgi:hypothetical protein
MYSRGLVPAGFSSGRSPVLMMRLARHQLPASDVA